MSHKAIPIHSAFIFIPHICTAKVAGKLKKLLGIIIITFILTLYSYIGLNSNDPFAPPKIVANYLSEPQDVRGLVAGIRIAQRLLNASILLDKYQTRLERLPYGTCETKHQ